MMIPITQLIFLAFSGTLLLSALMVVCSRNPVHSVLFLILAFFNAAGLFLLMGAELLAMTLIIVYVGAVAVLFLFVVMMFDLQIAQLRSSFGRYKWLSLAMIFLLLSEVAMIIFHWQLLPSALDILATPMQKNSGSNAQAIGEILYTDYLLLFQGSGIILLVSMIGAIVLTLRERHAPPLHQSIPKQIARTPAESISLENPPLRKGITL